jgi:hypothetical protein
MIPSTENPTVSTYRAKLQKVFVIIVLLWLPTFGGICETDSTPVTPTGTGHQSSITVKMTGPPPGGNVRFDGAIKGFLAPGGAVILPNATVGKTYVISITADDGGNYWAPQSLTVKPETDHTITFANVAPKVFVNLGIECAGTVSQGTVFINGENKGTLIAGGQLAVDVKPGILQIEFVHPTLPSQFQHFDARFGGKYTFNISC